MLDDNTDPSITCFSNPVEHRIQRDLIAMDFI